MALPFFGIGMKTDLFQSCGHCWVFQMCWDSECSTFTASSFRIWNSSTGIPSAPLALYVVMLPKAYLTLHSRMSGSRWVITPSWLCGSWRSFLHSSSAFSKTSLNIWKFMVKILLKSGLENFEHYFTNVWDECNCVVVWAFFGIAFFEGSLNCK